MEFGESQYHKRVFTFSYSYATSPIWGVIAERDSNQTPVVTGRSLQLTQKCVYIFRFIHLTAQLRYYFCDIANAFYREEETEHSNIFPLISGSRKQARKEGRESGHTIGLKRRSLQLTQNCVYIFRFINLLIREARKEETAVPLPGVTGPSCRSGLCSVSAQLSWREEVCSFGRHTTTTTR